MSVTSRYPCPVGIVTDRHVDTGALTQAGPERRPLFVVARSDIVTLKTDVPEAFAAEVDPVDRVEIRIQALKEAVVTRKVSRTSWALDPGTPTLRVEIDIPNPRGTLRPGLYTDATIVVAEHPDAITLPTTAVFGEKGARSCVVVVDGKARKQAITTGLADESRTEILSGLAGNLEQLAVVKAGSASLSDGQPVEVH